jgi:hypothetical protein
MVRVVFLLRFVGEAPSPAAPEGAASEMRSEKRLHAADFWMRNPDYLADALLDDYDAGIRPDGPAVVRQILAAREPDLRRLPMTKWRFGAYEHLDDVLAPLILHGLVVHRPTVRPNHSVAEHDFWLMASGAKFCNALLAADPATFGWYKDRAVLIADVAKDATGSALKARQYQRIEYASTPGMALIPSIAQDVHARLARVERADAA